MLLTCAVGSLLGDYGKVSQGQEFECKDERVALQLIAEGKAYRVMPPPVIHETTPEVSARPPFRDVPVPDEEPAPVAAESNPVLPGSNVSQQGTPHPRRRRGRKGSGSSEQSNPADSH